MTHLERNNDAITDYTYDPYQAFRLTRILTTSGQDTLQDLNYTYDPVGNILAITDNANTDLKKSSTYTYDDLNRLLSATVSYTNHPSHNYAQTFTYDSIGNMTSNSDLGTLNYLNNNPHQLTSVGTRNFVYDNAGNLNREIGLRKLYWDHRNRLKNTYDIASEDNTYYLYDHNNQRFIKWTEDYLYYPPDPEEPTEDLANRDLPRELSVSEDSLSEETLNLDGTGGYWAWTVVAMDRYVDKYFEKNLNNQTKSHIYLNDIKIATVNNNNDAYYILSDHLSSSSILIDSTGTTAQLTDYMPYGKINYENTILNLNNSYGFIDKELESETNLQYVGARYLDNQLARFASVDPVLIKIDSIQKVLSDPQSLNTYAYSRNNPIILVDRDGNFYTLFMAGLGAVAGGIWGAGDSYNMVKYTFRGDINTASYYSERYLNKMGAGLMIGWGLGEISEPYVKTYAPNAYQTIQGGQAIFIEDTVNRTVSINPNSNLRFSQPTIKSNFSSEPGVPKFFQNRSIDAVANDIRNDGSLVGQVRIDYIERDGLRIIDNSRSAVTLQRAGIDPSQWNWQLLRDPVRLQNLENRLANYNIPNGLKDIKY